MPKFDAGLSIQIDVKNNANGLFETVVISKSLSRWKHDAVVAVLPEQSLNSPERPGIVIDDKDNVPI